MEMDLVFALQLRLILLLQCRFFHLWRVTADKVAKRTWGVFSRLSSSLQNLDYVIE